MTTRTISINAAANITQRPRSWPWSVFAALNQVRTLLDEMHDNHATFKTAVDGIETLIEEMHDDHATLRTWLIEVDADLDKINDNIFFNTERDGVVGGNFTVTTDDDGGSDIDIDGVIIYRIGGKLYCYEGTAAEGHQLAGTGATGAGEVTASGWGAWRITINSKGVLGSDFAAPNDSAAQNHGSEEDALLSLAQSARGAGEIDIAYVSINAAGGGWTTGADDPITADAQVTAATIRAVRVPRIDNGLNAALGSGFVTGTTPEEYGYGTVDLKQNGIDLTQIALDDTRVFDDDDTIGNTQFGGWLLVTNFAKNAIYALGSNGIAGAVSVMTHADAGAANTQLDVIMAQLPVIFTVCSRLVIQNNLGGTWAANTDDLSGTDGTATFTDRTFGVFDRTVVSEDDSLVDAPVVPDSVTAPLVGTLGTGKPASAPGTLGSSKVDDFSTRELGTPS